MTPVVNYRNPTSALTLAYFEDTGWYQANFSVAEPLLWGNNKGCAFSSDNCVGPTTTTSGNLKPVDVATYCAADGEACSPDGLSRSWCSLKTDYAADDIPPWFQYFASPTTGGYEILQVCADINVVLVVVHSQGDCLNASNLALIPNTNLTPMGEMYGNDTSRCTLSSLRLANMFGYEYRTRAAGCYPMTCHGQTVQVSVKAADNGVVTVQCKYKGQVVTVAGFTGTLTCPDPFVVCQLAQCTTPCMDFLRSIEEDLNLVEAETKKKLPAVKDAAEKGIEKIGQIRQLYAQMLRVEAAPGPGNAIFKCDAILRPFLLACNHATASQKLLIASFNSIQKLVSWDAITSEAVGNILRVLQIQAERNSHQDIQLKLLQTLLQLLTLAFNKGDEQMTNEDLISQAIWICLHLQSQSGNAITANTAVMTLRQVVTMVFDNITTDAKNLDGAKKVGFLVFQDLCLMSREEVGMWLKRTTFSKILGVELLEAVLTSHGSLFRCDVEFRSMLKQHATHLITSNLSPSTPFPLLLRIMRLASTVLSQFTALLQDECNTIWLGLVEIVSTGSYSPNKSSLTPFVPMQRRSHQHHDASPQLRSMHSLSSTSGSTPTPHVSHNNLSSSVNSVTWHVLLAMEVIYKALGDPDVLPALSSYPNHLLLVLARTVAAVVATSPPCDYRPGHVDASMPYRCGLEYLNEQDAPPLQPFYNVLRISLLCQYHVLTVLHANDRHLSPLRVQYILCSVAPFVMNALHCTMRFCREAELVTVALKGYHLLTNVNAHSRDRIPLDGRPIGVLAIQALCVFSFPVPPDMSTRVVKCISGNGAVVTIEGPDGGDGGASDGMANSDQQHHQQQQCVLTWKEMHAMKTLFRTIHTMEQELNEVEWRTLLEGFEVIVGLSALKQKTKGVNQRIGTGPSAVKVEDEDVEQQLVMLGQSILEYFTNTSALHPSSLLHILRAIRSICYDQISHLPPAAAPTSSSTVASQSSTDDAMLVEEELQQLLALWSPDQQTAWDVLSVPFGLHVKTFETTLGIGGGGNNNSNAAPFTPAFSLRMFVQLAKANVDAWTFVMDELVGFVCLSPTSSSSPSPLPFQMYATDAVFQLVQAALTTIPSLSQSTVTAYVLRAIQSDQMKERALVGLLDLLQTTGHLITQDAWPAILEALGTSAEADARCQVVAFK
ncbi:hypothetical protein DYB37_010437, partial [Aphanomyces astaci]